MGTQLPPRKGAQQPPRTFRSMSVAKRSPISATAELLLTLFTGWKLRTRRVGYTCRCLSRAKFLTIATNESALILTQQVAALALRLHRHLLRYESQIALSLRIVLSLESRCRFIPSFLFHSRARSDGYAGCPMHGGHTAVRLGDILAAIEIVFSF